ISTCASPARRNCQTASSKRGRGFAGEARAEAGRARSQTFRRMSVFERSRQLYLVVRRRNAQQSEATEMIERSQHEGILTLRLAHGKASAIDVELLDALLRELEGVATDVRAVVLTGTGSIFSAGVDLFRLIQEGADYVRRFLPLLSRFLGTLFTFPG